MILVTGASGIIGSHVLLNLILQGKEVVAGKQKNSRTDKTLRLFEYYSPGNAALFNKIKWVEIDITDIYSIEEACVGVKEIYHCSGYVSFDKRNRKKLFKINEEGTANIVTICLEKKIRLCHVSSVAAINNADFKTELNENVFWKRSGKESDYAISKYNAEREVWRGIEEGLEAVIVNPAVVLAPGFWSQSSSRIFTTCYKGNIFYTEGKVGLVSANDVARIMIRLMQERHFGNRYILQENTYTYEWLFKTVSKNFNKKLPYIKAGRGLLNLGRAYETFIGLFVKREPILTKSIVNAALNKQNLSAAKIKNTLNYEFESSERLISSICSLYLRDHLQKPA